MKTDVIRAFIVLSIVSLSALNAQDVTSPNRSAVLAEVNGKTVTVGELEQKRADTLFQARRTYYQAELKALDDLIDEQLLEGRAQREHLTVEQLLDRHVNTQIQKDPTDEQLEVFYESLGTDKPLEAVRGEILSQLHTLRISKARAAYLKLLRSEAKISVTLQEPRVDVAFDGKSVRGPRNAPVRIVEFADYQCPYCKQIEPQIERLRGEFGDKIAIAFMDFPLPMHTHAEKMAEAADCAGAQGKFWDYHDFLFNDLKDPFNIAVLKEQARNLKLDQARFDTCLDSNGQATQIKAEMAEGTRLGITGTPALFINGRFLSGSAKYETLREIVQEELSSASPQVRQTAER